MKTLLLATLLASSAHPATLTWSPPTTNIDGSAISGTITYNIYQAPQGQTLAKVQTGVASTTATVTTNLTLGTTQCFAVTALVNGVESSQSTSACLVIPLPTPSAPTNLAVH